MSRVSTANYGAETTTQFAWATTDQDYFDREADLFHLARAVELHDHSAGRGLEVARVATNAVATVALQALSVTAEKIANLAVTNAKLAAGAVTREKITFPLIQATNDMAGGFRQSDTSSVYAMGFYMAANGLAVIGAGTVGTVNGNIVLGQAGQVSIGTTQGAAKFNVMSTGQSSGSGLRVYNANPAYFSEFYQDATGSGILGTNGYLNISLEPNARGGVVIGAGVSTSALARLTLHQASGAASEGFHIAFGSGVARQYLDASGNHVLSSLGATVMLHHVAPAFGPTVDQNITLGTATIRWAQVWTMTLHMAGAISGVTNLTMTGAIIGVTTVTSTTVAFSGTITSTGITISGTTNAHILNVTGSLTTASGILLCSTNLYPNTTGENRNLGALTNKWNELFCQAAYNNSGSWGTYSDDKVKTAASFRPYTTGLAAILAMEPTYFKYNGDFDTDAETEMLGLRAQQVETVAPELVRSVQGKRRPESRRPEELKTILPGLLVYPLVNAVKELKAEIDELRALLKDRKN